MKKITKVDTLTSSLIFSLKFARSKIYFTSKNSRPSIERVVTTAMHCFHVYLSGKKCPAAFVELRLTSTFMCVVVSSPSLSSLLLSGFLNFLSKLLSNHVRCSLLIFPINEPFFRRMLHCKSLLQHIGICLAKCRTSQIRSFKFASSSSDSLPQSVNGEF